MQQVKYFRITADYRPNNPNKPTYDFIVKGGATKKEIKEYFQHIYSWLKVYDVEEISECQCSEWAMKLVRRQNSKEI